MWVSSAKAPKTATPKWLLSFHSGSCYGVCAHTCVRWERHRVTSTEKATKRQLLNSIAPNRVWLTSGHAQYYPLHQNPNSRQDFKVEVRFWSSNKYQTTFRTHSNKTCTLKVVVKYSFILYVFQVLFLLLLSLNIWFLKHEHNLHPAKLESQFCLNQKRCWLHYCFCSKQLLHNLYAVIAISQHLVSGTLVFSSALMFFISFISCFWMQEVKCRKMNSGVVGKIDEVKSFPSLKWLSHNKQWSFSQATGA